ncbi:PepSY domain-containing protein, partial [Escherichia coli]|nr:PepSY domain-containing protein [Escherichia coli]
LYRLHFFDQIPFYIGRYIAGFVALFFLFAVIAGVLIHWRNIVSKFYGFSLKGSLKQIWTSSHTVFGLLGLPFQLMYAVTGAYYMLSILILAP